MALNTFLDNLGVLVDFACNRHVDELVPDGHQHAPDNGGVHLHGQVEGLSLLEETSERSLDFFLSGCINVLSNEREDSKL